MSTTALQAHFDALQKLLTLVAGRFTHHQDYRGVDVISRVNAEGRPATITVRIQLYSVQHRAPKPEIWVTMDWDPGSAQYRTRRPAGHWDQSREEQIRFLLDEFPYADQPAKAV